MTDPQGIFQPLRFDEDGNPINSGWRPVTQQDQQLLATSRGSLADSIDVDRLLAMPARDTFLWIWLASALKKFHNDPNYVWENQYQKFGTCVGQAAKVAADDLLAINSELYGMEFPGRTAVASAYTFSRVEIAGQPGGWEGSNGYQAAAGQIRYGNLLLRDLDLPDNAKDEDENLAMQWTRSRNGVPDKYQALAGNLLVKDTVTPANVMMAAKLIQAGSPQYVGTTYIPTGKCNSKGVSSCRRGRLGHEMAVRAVIYDANGNPIYFLQQQSWFPGWATGPKLIPDQPMESVWITAQDYGIQLADGDANSILGVNGLKYVD